MWLSRLIAILLVGILTACTGLSVTPLGTNFTKDDLRIAVIGTGGRNGQIYSRALNSLIGGGCGSCFHPVLRAVCRVKQHAYSQRFFLESEKAQHDSQDYTG